MDLKQYVPSHYCGGAGFFSLLTLMFVYFKLMGLTVVSTWSWLWVLSPLWLPIVCVLALIIAILVIVIVCWAIVLFVKWLFNLG